MRVYYLNWLYKTIAGHLFEIAPRQMTQDIATEKSTLVQGMVPAGNKPSSKPMLTQKYVAMCIVGMSWATKILGKLVI